ncbi:MAG TPA: 6,7-dimethyl-8-ribityllumazine synthase [Gaiellaceae bacterium]|nr:6,7-dimethyl-8-ribityllumazine synthase [Gaiellaceae bacterium]
MTTGRDVGTYDPFEDTGDWPFRDAPPKPEQGAIVSTDDVEPRAVAPRSFGEDTELAASAAEPEPGPGEEEESAPEAEAPEMDAPGAAELVASAPADVEEVPGSEVAVVEEAAAAPAPQVAEHAPGTLAIPPGVDVLTGGPHGFRRNVAVVVSRWNGDITTGLLESALEALRECNVADDAVTVVPVPGAFELPLAALALAKTRRYSCVVALGCVIRGETPHFDLIASEAASGLQLAAIETGIPVAFGVITTETREQAEARIDRGGEAARTALEMADLFSHVRTRAAAT